MEASDGDGRMKQLTSEQTGGMTLNKNVPT